MSLVAYYSGSSDEGSDNEMDTGEPVAAAVTSIINPGPSTSNSETSNSSGTGGTSKGVFQKFSKFEDDSDNETADAGVSENSLKFDILPKPLEENEVVGEMEDLEEGPIPPKKIYDGQMEEKPPEKPSSFSGFEGLKAQKLGGRIQISAPSLKDFEEEVPEKKEKVIVQPGKKGSGLFSILPPPKHESVKVFSFTKKQTTLVETSVTESEVSSSKSSAVQRPTKAKSLIPDAVRQNMLGKRPTPSKLEEIKSKYLKQEANVRIVSRSIEKPGQNSDSEEEEESDFFSFTKASEPIPDDPSLRLPDYVPPEPEDIQMTTTEEASYSYVEQPGTSSAINPAQFIRKGKKKNEPVNFIDVKADDLRPDNIEWMRNLTSEEAPPPSRPKNAPGGMVKRKHQITYLAFEAKAREQTLKNQWSQNKHNKRVTQSKYGF